MNLNQELLSVLKQEGCDIVGFADLRILPEEPRKKLDTGIIIGVPYVPAGMEMKREDNPIRFADGGGGTFEPLERYNQITVQFLKERKYKANVKYSTTQITMKMLATIAGIGWIGKCAILTTKETGPALRFTAVLTNAPFEHGTPIIKSQCPPDCTDCADACPTQAIKGGLWERGIHRDEFFDVEACKKHRSKVDGYCCICMSACPFTKQGLGYV